MHTRMAMLWVITVAALAALSPPGGRLALLSLAAVIIAATLVGWRWGSRWRVPAWAEITFLTGVVLVASSILRITGTDWQIGGREIAYLTNSGVIAGDMLQHFGGVPLWNPLIGMGEPLVENPFSFVFNPLMSGPFLLLDRVTAVKVALSLHVMLVSWGGYAWGHALRLAAVGRLTLGVLLGGFGSMAGLLAEGFFQMTSTLAYVPWIFAGLYGVLGSTGQARRRWGGVLAVATVLMLLAGTFWYVLPTAISAALVVLVTMTGPHPDRRAALAHLTVAAVLVILLGAVRLLPTAVHAAYVDHPVIHTTPGNLTYTEVGARLFIPDTSTAEMTYHYTVPLELALCLLVGRLLVGVARPVRPRLLVTAVTLVTFYILWATEGSTFSRWLYTHASLIEHWRFPQRMLAAAGPRAALVVALWADDIARWLSAGDNVWVRRALRVLLVILIARAGVDVLLNWERLTPTRESQGTLANTAAALRDQHPSALVAVATPNFHHYDDLLAQRLRVTLGNPDYYPLWPPVTIGTLPSTVRNLYYNTGPMWLRRQATARYATDDYTFLERQEVFTEADYNRLPTPPGYDFAWLLWERPGTAPYAFAGHEATLATLEHLPLAPVIQQPLSYWHAMDRVTVAVPTLTEPSVVLIHETAYPGWRVTVNGTTHPLEIVAGYTAVRVAPDETPATVRFTYRPVWLFAGLGITILGFGVMWVYLLGLPAHKQTIITTT